MIEDFSDAPSGLLSTQRGEFPTQGLRPGLCSFALSALNPSACPSRFHYRFSLDSGPMIAEMTPFFHSLKD